jgi:hypothetical protein
LALAEGIEGAFRRIKWIFMVLLTLAFLAGSIASFTIAAVSAFASRAAGILDRRVALSAAEEAAMRKELRETGAELDTAGTRAGVLEADLDTAGTRAGVLEADLDTARARAGTLAADLDAERTRAGTLEARPADARQPMQAMRKLTDSIANRVARQTLRSIGAIPAESLPLLGAATLAGMSVNECDAYAVEERDLLEGEAAEAVHAELRAICDCKAYGRMVCLDLTVSDDEAGRA